MEATIYDFEYHRRKRENDLIGQCVAKSVMDNQTCVVIKIKQSFKEWLKSDLELKQYVQDKNLNKMICL